MMLGSHATAPLVDKNETQHEHQETNSVTQPQQQPQGHPQVQLYQSEWRQPQSVMQYEPAQLEDIAAGDGAKQPPPLTPQRLAWSSMLGMIGTVFLFCSLTPIMFHSHVDGELSENSIDIGSFSIATHFMPVDQPNDSRNAKAIQSTSSFDNSCRVEWTPPGKEQQSLVMKNCNLWKTAGAMIIVGGSLGSFGLIAQFSAFYYVPNSFLIRHLATFLPLFASICGFISMSIYKYESDHDPGLQSNDQFTTQLYVSFYFLMISSSFLAFAAPAFSFRVGSCCPCSPSAAEGENPSSPPLTLSRALRLLAHFSLTLLGTLLLIIALVSPGIYHTRTDADHDSFQDIGAYFYSSHFVVNQTEYWPTSSINNECQIQLTVFGVEMPPQQIIQNCSLWSAARGMFLVAVILGGIGFSIQLRASLRCCARNAMLRRLGWISPLISCMFGLISMAIYVNEKDHDSDIEPSSESTTTFGYAFYLLALGCGFLSGGAAAFGWPEKKKNAVLQNQLNQFIIASRFLLQKYLSSANHGCDAFEQMCKGSSVV